jgi:hypothetical protein
LGALGGGGDDGVLDDGEAGGEGAAEGAGAAGTGMDMLPLQHVLVMMPRGVEIPAAWAV